MTTDNDCERMPGTGANKGKATSAERLARIRDLNDRLRCHAQGGVWRVTSGIASLPPETTRGILKAVAAFSNFTADNDPWGEHDCAVIEIDGHSVIWKIDYYDRTQQFHSPDAANPKVTVRVLTVMLSHEY